MANLFFLRLRIDAIAAAPAGERLGQRRGRRDRIPRAHRGAAVHRAERGGGVALDEDAIADRVGAPQRQPDRALQVRQRPVAAHVQRLHVRRDQLVAAAELLGQQLLDLGHVHLQQRRQRAEIDDVLEQLPLPRVGVGLVGDLGQRHADDHDVVAEPRRRHRLGVVVEQVAARHDRGDVLLPGLRVHRHHQVHAAAARAQMARLGDAHLIPGRQALDVAGEDVARRHRHAHAQDRLGEQRVRAGRTRAVDVGELDDEVVDALETSYAFCRLQHACSACATSIRKRCISHAPVGHRSAHRPQCRQTSSSFTITRPVFSAPET